MPRRYPDRRRLTPGRHPPNRFRGPGGKPRPGGFTSHGMGAFYNLLMPGLQGPAKKAFFNQISTWLLGGIALSGAMIGLAALGPLGAILGLGAAIIGGSWYVKDQRFYRP